MTDVASLVECAGENVLEESDEQLCGNWCGALHYSSSPACTATSCSAFARQYDADAGWTPPPMESAPSCTGFVPSDAGVADAGSGIAGCESDAGADAAVDAGSDASAGNIGGDAGPSNDGGATPSGDAGAMDAGGGDASVSPAPDAGGPDGAAPFPDGSTTPVPPIEPDDGCDCSVRGGRTKPPDLAGLGVALWLLGRGLRSRKRRERASGT
jgi:hypothetical protein